MKQLFGTNVEVTNRAYDYKTYKTSKQYTSTYAPQVTQQYTMGYNPQLNIGSPNANIGGSGGINPISMPQVITMPSTAQLDAPQTQEAAMGGGGGNSITDILIVAAVGIGAIILLPKLLKGVKLF